MFRLFLLAALLAGSARAECVTADDLTRGISFTRQDGHSGHVQKKGTKVEVEYVTDRDRWYDSRATRLGIHDTHFSAWMSDAYLLGSLPPEFDWTYGTPPPEPAAGKTWTTAITQIETDVGFGSYMRRQVTHQRTDLVGRFTVLDAGQGKLSGCTYRILPVEATFKGGGKSLARRWIYFPDLGFGLETKRDGVQNGLTALTRG
ncbi:MAG: hypothetical protein B7Y00_04135 [Sphingomonadales bacterium 17-56-6]|nr:MAG: hypothetical protein B7Y00_04135 [Sphingomonadales bacterium 17-56-6]